MTSAGRASASAAGVGQRSSQAVQRGITRSTCVCWSMNSETTIAYGSRVRRQGRSRPWRGYQRRRDLRNARMFFGGMTFRTTGFYLVMSSGVETSLNILWKTTRDSLTPLGMTKRPSVERLPRRRLAEGGLSVERWVLNSYTHLLTNEQAINLRA